jgi:xanthine dehydrogenase molybdenum-binding subunit
VQWAKEEGRPSRLTFEYEAPKTQPLGTGGDMHFAFSYAAQAALVEVDTESGEVQVLRVVAAHDIGRAINPLSLEGQIEGGIVMGLGNALTEEYIVENGVPYTQWLARYKMPSIRHTPKITSFIVDVRGCRAVRSQGCGRNCQHPHDARHHQRNLQCCGREGLHTPGGSR